MCRSPRGSGESGRGNRPSTEVEGTVANLGRTSSKPGEGRADKRTAQGPVSFLHEEGERQGMSSPYNLKQVMLKLATRLQGVICYCCKNIMVGSGGKKPRPKRLRDKKAPGIKLCDGRSACAFFSLHLPSQYFIESPLPKGTMITLGYPEFCLA